MKNVGEETTAKYFVRGKVDGRKERRKEGRKTTLYTLISNTKLVVEKTKNLICTTESSKGSEFQFNSVVADSMWPHALQHASLPCPSPIPRACSKSCPSSRWCHPTVSSSVVTFSSCLQSFPASFPGSFPVSQFFTSGGQIIGASASATVLPVNIQDWFPLGLTGWISLQSRGLSRVSNTTVQKHHFFGAQLSLWSNSHVGAWLLEKP